MEKQGELLRNAQQIVYMSSLATSAHLRSKEHDIFFQHLSSGGSTRATPDTPIDAAVLPPPHPKNSASRIRKFGLQKQRKAKQSRRMRPYLVPALSKEKAKAEQTKAKQSKATRT